jgi:GNAT superfamily N-acetyltransferase
MTDVQPRTIPLHERRSTLGASTVLWAGPTGVRVYDDRWVALSGAPSVEYNVALVHGSGGAIDETVVDVLEAGAPAVVMVTGRALQDLGRLRARRWKPVGDVALMHLDLRARPAISIPHPARRLDAGDHEAVRQLVGEVFGVGPHLAAVAISGATARLDGQELWGAFDPSGALTSCLATSWVNDTVTVWSMATSRLARRQGYGAAALNDALAAAARAGATSSLLSSSNDGQPLYRALGYRELERWQQWSRPRWVLARG